MNDEDALSTLLYQISVMTKNGKIDCTHGTTGTAIRGCARCQAEGVLGSSWLQEHRMRWLDMILEDEDLLARIAKLIEERMAPPDVIKVPWGTPGPITWAPASGGTVTGTSTVSVTIDGSSLTSAAYRAILGYEV